MHWHPSTRSTCWAILHPVLLPLQAVNSYTPFFSPSPFYVLSLKCSLNYIATTTYEAISAGTMFIQSILNHNIEWATSKIFDELEGHLGYLSVHKCSSHSLYWWSFVYSWIYNCLIFPIPSTIRWSSVSLERCLTKSFVNNSFLYQFHI